MKAYLVQHPLTKMFLAKRELPRSERTVGAYKLVGAAGSYKWVRTEVEAERFPDESAASRAALFVRREDATIKEIVA